jgi:hypothetical protein
VGQIVVHGANSQWLQRITVNIRRVLGNSPFSMYFTQVRSTPIGTSCSLLQATVQAWQPMHLRLSIKKPKDVIYRTGGRAIYRSVRSTRVDEPLGYLSKIGAASRQREMELVAQYCIWRVLDAEIHFMSDAKS